MKCVVKITEMLSRTIIVDADSPGEAEEKAEQIYNNENIVLDYRDYDGYEITALRPVSEEDFELYDDMEGLK